MKSRHETSKGYSMIFESLIFFPIYDFGHVNTRKYFFLLKYNILKKALKRHLRYIK